MSNPTSPGDQKPQWWLSKKGNPRGPYDADFILDGLRAGKIPSDTFACLVGGVNWKRLSESKTFAAACAKGAADGVVNSRPEGTELGGRSSPPTGLEAGPDSKLPQGNTDSPRAVPSRLDGPLVRGDYRFKLILAGGAGAIFLLGILLWGLSGSSKNQLHPAVATATGGPIVNPMIPASKETSVRTFELPILYVSEVNDKSVGTVGYAKLAFERKQPTSEPLKVSVAEDTPGGAGETMRAAIWQAAAAAGLQRHDDLCGLKISAEFAGRVDGPSAGAMLCVAILSFLDGRDLPRNCAFTGTVLPDGTVGEVGGIAHKMRAAKDAGFHRVLIPDNLRYQQDLNTGENVDLKKLADSLGLECVQVQTIEQAFRCIQGTPLLPAYVDSKGTMAIPQEVENELMERTRTAISEADDMLKLVSKRDMDDLNQDPISRDAIKSGIRAKRSLASGHLLYAFQSAVKYRLFMRARDENLRFFSRISANDENYVRFCDAEVESKTKAIPADIVAVDAIGRELAPIASQFAIGAAVLKDQATLLEQICLDGLTDRLTEIEHAKPSDVPAGISVRQASISAIERVKHIQVLIANEAKLTHDDSLGLLKRLALALPATTPVSDDRLKSVERFFFDAQKAAWQTLATNLGQAEPTAYEKCRLLANIRAAENLHSRYFESHETGKPNVFAAALCTQLYATNIAGIGGILVRHVELGGKATPQSTWDYADADKLPAMLNSARTNASINIAACQQQGIPCPAASASFQSAELKRDDSEEDKVDVLMSYWEASLQAQVLQMLFESSKK